jgi:hypothetical protein
MKTKKRNEPKNYTQYEIDEMKKLLRSGASYASVGRRFKCDAYTVKKYAGSEKLLDGYPTKSAGLSRSWE